MAKEMELMNHLVLGHLLDRKNPLLNHLKGLKQQNKERNKLHNQWLSQVLVQSQ
jgi:hypothetical protein|uniref:Uncharacterized protein n=1 Tax=Picea glauca TaxID=3330 RepID=A0A101LYG9_PICGL|nr:hypothetical protein ABT39_MTgene5851 [Picea glauca]QHR92336.1 hypothetical protein Q903MT_gene6378 [Picea sitchensis]